VRHTAMHSGQVRCAAAKVHEHTYTISSYGTTSHGIRFLERAITQERAITHDKHR